MTLCDSITSWPESPIMLGYQYNLRVKNCENRWGGVARVRFSFVVFSETFHTPGSVNLKTLEHNNPVNMI